MFSAERSTFVCVRGTPFGRLVVPLVCRSSAKSSPPGFPEMERDNCGNPFRPTAPDESTDDGHITKLRPAAACTTGRLLHTETTARGVISTNKRRSSPLVEAERAR